MAPALEQQRRGSVFRKTFALVLLGFLITGTATIGYGTFLDKGFVASAAGVLGAGDNDRDGGHDEDKDDD